MNGMFFTDKTMHKLHEYEDYNGKYPFLYELPLIIYPIIISTIITKILEYFAIFEDKIAKIIKKNVEETNSEIIKKNVENTNSEIIKKNVEETNSEIKKNVEEINSEIIKEKVEDTNSKIIKEKVEEANSEINKKNIEDTNSEIKKNVEETNSEIIKKNVEETKSEIKKQINEYIDSIKWKFVIFFLLMILFLLLFWYYLSSFCAVFYNTQEKLITDVLLGYVLALIYPFINAIIICSLRYFSLRSKNKNKGCLYKTSNIIGYIILLILTIIFTYLIFS